MKDQIRELSEAVKGLEKEFSELKADNFNHSESFKEKSLEVLASLKRAQDDPENMEEDEIFEDLIFRLITIVGHLDTP